MRSFHPLGTLLLTLTLALLTGCSKDVERIVANERFLRGQENIGETLRQAEVADRDTYVQIGLRNQGSTLLVGEEDGFVAESFLRVASWSLPADTLPGLVIDSVYFAIPRDSTFTRAGNPFRIEMSSIFGGLPISSTTYDFGTLRLDLGAPFIETLREWAAHPLQAPTLRLSAPDGGGMGGFQAGLGAFHVRFRTAVDTTGSTSTSRATTDYYAHSPIAPAPTGTEPTLVLGGRYETMIVLRADMPAIPPGSSLNEAAWILRLDGIGDPLEGNGFVTGKTYLDVDVFRLTRTWSESATDTTGMGAGPAIPALRFHQMEPATDSTLVIPIPLDWMRGWAADTTTNHGVLIAFPRWRNPQERTIIRDNQSTVITVNVPIGANISPPIHVESRESARPPEFRVSYTSPPPGRL